MVPFPCRAYAPERAQSSRPTDIGFAEGLANDLARSAPESQIPALHQGLMPASPTALKTHRRSARSRP